MKKLLCILMVVLMLTGCYSSMPHGYHERNRTFATKTHARAYALRMKLKGYDVEIKTYQQWWNHGTYWYGVYIKDEETEK